MKYFKKINKAWREGIDAEIRDADGGKQPAIAYAFREKYARYLLEVVISRTPSKVDLEEIGCSYSDFSEGWNSAVYKLLKTPKEPIVKKDSMGFLFLYGIFSALTQFVEEHGWKIVAAKYKRPEIKPCPKGEHEWDGRSLAGIAFRRCNKCELIQSACYTPYFVDHHINISKNEWFRQEQVRTEDLPPGTAMAWH